MPDFRDPHYGTHRCMACNGEYCFAELQLCPWCIENGVDPEAERRRIRRGGNSPAPAALDLELTLSMLGNYNPLLQIYTVHTYIRMSDGKWKFHHDSRLRWSVERLKAELKEIMDDHTHLADRRRYKIRPAGAGAIPYLPDDHP
jgi:hypothetical protein